MRVRISCTFVVLHIKLDLSGCTLLNYITLWCFVSTNVWVLCVCHGHEGQKRVLDTWELKLQKVINSHVGAGTQIGTSLGTPLPFPAFLTAAPFL